MLISISTNLALAPLELLKVRAQLVQEGRILHGGNLERGVSTLRTFSDVIDAGYGLRGLWTG